MSGIREASAGKMGIAEYSGTPVFFMAQAYAAYYFYPRARDASPQLSSAMKIRSLSLSLLLLLPLPLARALTIEGVNVPPQAIVSGQTLPLNGAGLRTVVLLVIPVKAYVAAFYAPTPLRSEQAVLSSPGPLKFTFTFLQGVGQGQVTQAWTTQFQQSATYSYPGLAKDQSAFVALFGPLKKGGVESVEIEGGETRVYDQGVLKGTINGRDFQKAFLSLWFGSNPVMPELKAALLGI